MAAKLMRAVQYSKYGGGAAGLKHVEVPIPFAKADEVLIRVEATAINPVDWKIQKGVMRALFIPRKFPCTPCTDVSGEVVAVGSQVKDLKVGQKVVAMLTLAYGGGLAEYAVAKESTTVPRPPELSAIEAAPLVVACVTAYVALCEAGIKLDQTGPPKNILVTAASGGVGHYAVQLAKLGNTHVTATCGARNVELVKNLGADEVLDYKTPIGSSLKSPSGKRYDAVIHCTSGIAWSTFEPNLTENGVVIDLTPGPSTMITFAVKKITGAKKKIVPLIVTPKKEDIETVIGLVKVGKLKTVFDSKYPFSRAEEAWAKSIEGHATGKIVVEF